MFILGEVVLIKKFLGGVRDLDLDIFWSIEQGSKIKITSVKIGKLGSTE